MEWFYCFFFFFQAEDGIRDGTVTGVQTYALPISFVGVTAIAKEIQDAVRRGWQGGHEILRQPAHEEMHVPIGGCEHAAKARSEERRVGKECRSRWTAYHEKKKKDNVLGG